jgi:hypothetical protein
LPVLVTIAAVLGCINSLSSLSIIFEKIQTGKGALRVFKASFHHRTRILILECPPCSVISFLMLVFIQFSINFC